MLLLDNYAIELKFLHLVSFFFCKYANFGEYGKITCSAQCICDGRKNNLVILLPRICFIYGHWGQRRNFAQNKVRRNIDDIF